MCGQGPPEGVVGELEFSVVADLVDHRAVEAVSPLGVAPGGGGVLVVAPDQELLGNLPRGVELVHPGDDLVTSGDPTIEDLLGVRVERNAPPLAVPLALSTNGDVILARILVEVDVRETQPVDLHDPEAETELQVDNDLFQRGLLHFHELLGLFVREPVDVGADVLAEVHTHLLHNVVLEVGEVPPQDVQIPVLGGHREVASHVPLYLGDPELLVCLDIVFAMFPSYPCQNSLSQNTATFFPINAMSGFPGIVLMFLW